mmetsp:Transcript_47/g.92  ORF Transcript_47/g.92 Transcript_47/m.92 type:complete len:253 (+) Transcript_47:554-1312(+)
MRAPITIATPSPSNSFFASFNSTKSGHDSANDSANILAPFLDMEFSARSKKVRPMHELDIAATESNLIPSSPIEHFDNCKRDIMEPPPGMAQSVDNVPQLSEPIGLELIARSIGLERLLLGPKITSANDCTPNGPMLHSDKFNFSNDGKATFPTFSFAALARQAIPSFPISLLRDKSKCVRHFEDANVLPIACRLSFPRFFHPKSIICNNPPFDSFSPSHNAITPSSPISFDPMARLEIPHFLPLLCSAFLA